MDKFITFLNSLDDQTNSDLLSAIKRGYDLIESLSTDDANNKPFGLNVTHIKPASILNYLQNKDNEYFPQTLGERKIQQIEKAYIGKRMAQFPAAGRTALGSDSLKKDQSTYNVNGVGGDYAGGGTGYNLGAP